MALVVVIVAAGSGLRLGGPVPKQYQKLAGRAVLARSVDAALAARIDRVVVAINPEARDLYDAAMAGTQDPRLAGPVDGGPSRAETVARALEALAPTAPRTVLIHDAARPFAPPALFETLAATTGPGLGAIAAEPVVDALWYGPEGDALEPRPRDGLWRAQTPQAFPFADLLAAHRRQAGAETPALDDAEVFRRAGHRLRLVAGTTENYKITRPEDMLRAETMLAKGAGMDLRVGHGFDVHIFCPGEHVWLCGVRIPHSAGLKGHSDADVGLHALADALYGAIAEGDIGQHFPPSDPQWKGAESHIFLAHAGRRVAERGGRIANLDVTLLCERPKIGPHAPAMRARIGEILGLDPGRVSIKATTMEKMGFVGREEGMGALATATVVLDGLGGGMS
ncbi:MAG: bifunctional 2-C-methyl-D-erythritol 4-phosphate cytidylyltransferase/2-C-methyl-D-erythritol 2,4-cyclodiphosphate synthase [Pikeienuella sp.]